MCCELLFRGCPAPRNEWDIGTAYGTASAGDTRARPRSIGSEDPNPVEKASALCRDILNKTIECIPGRNWITTTFYL